MATATFTPSALHAHAVKRLRRSAPTSPGARRKVPQGSWKLSSDENTAADIPDGETTTRHAPLDANASNPEAPVCGSWLT